MEERLYDLIYIVRPATPEDEIKNFRLRKARCLLRGQQTLSDRALAFIVSELSRYDLSNSDIDAKGLAYQEIVGANMRGDRGQ